MSHLFISYSNRDGNAAAHPLAAGLEAAGMPCWIAPRDVKAGRTYPAQIVNAIRESSGLVLLLTPGANRSRDVLQEVQRAHQEDKIIAALILQATEPWR